MATERKYLSLEKLGLYDQKIKQYIDTAEADALAASKSYSDSLADNYDGAGSAATAETNAKTYTDGEITKVNTAVATAQTQADKGVADAATADGKAVKAQEDVDALKTYVGTIPEEADAATVIAYVDKKTEGIATNAALGELQATVTQLGKDIDAVEADYLKTADKTELEGKITTAQTAADSAQEYAEGVAGDLAKEVKAREDADTAQAERIATLEGQITGLSGAMHFKGVETELPADVSAYKEGDVIIVGEKEYVFNGTAFVEFGDVSVEGERIAALETHKTQYEAKVATLEGEMDDVQAAVAAKVEKTAYDTKVEALEATDTDHAGRIEALEAKFGEGEGNVESQIETAKQEAISEAKSYTDTQDATTLASAKGYTDAEIDKVEATVATLTETVGTKAAQTDLEALAGRVSTAEGEIDVLQTDLDAAELLIAANDAAIKANAQAIALKASKEELATLEAKVTANTEAISAFVEISETEINNLFA